jgi:SOS response regulatory protein OraA/RecX
MPRVTALRRASRRQILVEVDGEPWRAFPESVVVATRLARGQELDRARLVALARERRRAEALDVATRALRHRDLSGRRLAERLERAGVPEAARAETLDRLTRAGLVDDERFALARAQGLAARGFGDAANRDALAREQLDGERIESALSVLEPERERARRIVARRGATAATARYLARRGFADDSVETAVPAFAETEARAYD